MQYRGHLLDSGPVLTGKEMSVMATVHNAYRMELSTEVPIFLVVSESNLPLYDMGEFKRDPKRDQWSSSLKEGLLRPHAQRMIHRIVQFFRSQSEYEQNLSVLMVCRELIEWIIHLSEAPCNVETLDTLRRRSRYLETILDSGCFSRDAELLKLFSLLRHEVLIIISTLEWRLFENQQVEHLESIIYAARNVLSYGFNFLYYILSDIENLYYPNITLFSSEDPIYSEIARTQAGQLLTRLRHSPECCVIFPENAVLGLSEKELFQRISPNPFLRSVSASLIPSELIEDSLFGTAVDQGLWEDLGHYAHAGILRQFKEDPELLATFINMHAILKDWASVVLLLVQFNSRSKGGTRVLESDNNIKRSTLLMKNLCNIGAALVKCQNDLSDSVDRHALALQSGPKIKLRSEQVCWLANYQSVKPIDTQLFEALDTCLNQVRHFQAMQLTMPMYEPPTQGGPGLSLRNPVDYFFGKTRPDSGASKRAMLVPRVQIIKLQEAEFVRHPVGEEDAYEPFGLDRVAAYQCLFQHITTVRNLAKPVLQEVLFANEEFANWLSDEHPGVKKASAEYHAALGRNDPEIQRYWNALNGFCEDLNLFDQFIVYNVLHKRAGQIAHPLILGALAHIKGVNLSFYAIAENGEMMVHPRFPNHVSPNATQTICLLSIDGKRYEKVELRQEKQERKVYSDSNFGGSATLYQPASPRSGSEDGSLKGQSSVLETSEMEVSSMAESDNNLGSPSTNSGKK